MDSKVAYEKLTLTDNFMFEKVMRNEEFCKHLLEIILGIKIDHIEFPENEKTVKITYASKGIRMDVYVADEEGTVYNVEMQTTNTGDIPKRSRYYHSMIDLNKIEKGEVYSHLTKSYVIFICTFDPFGEGLCIYNFPRLCKQNPKLCLNDGTETVFLNVFGIDSSISKELNDFLSYLACGVPTDSFTEKLEGALDEAKNNKEWRAEYMYWEAESQLLLDRGHKEGREEGIKAVVSICKNFGMQVNQVANQVALQFNLPYNSALSYTKKYW